jgi:beta-xylosidase
MEIRQINTEQKNNANRKLVSLRGINPLIPMDYPDPDVIRVEDTYYMASTTMHFFPGCEILTSKDLLTWEHAAYVYDRLDSTPGQRLADGKGIYGKGMWAPSLRYHEGTFYLMFAANDTKTTYLYRAASIEGPWEKSVIAGFYHDGSLLFDEDRVYVAYGNREIRLTELKSDLSGPKEGGLDRILIRESEDNHFLGYEGSHLQKIRGRYYLFNIHSLTDRWMRTQSCFSAASLTSEFIGGDILCDDLGYFGQGIAQGGIVDTPEGKWYGIFFQDRGGAGRMPMILPITWKGDQPVIGEGGIAPAEIEISVSTPDPTNPVSGYRSLFGSDDFQSDDLKPYWQWNHEPETDLVNYGKNTEGLTLRTDRVCRRMDLSVNTLTQRLILPRCSGTVTVSGKDLKTGDRAGLGILCEEYTYLALEKTEAGTDLIYVAIKGGCGQQKDPEEQKETPDDSRKILQRIPLDPERGETIVIRAEVSSFAPVGNVTYAWKYAEEEEFCPLPFCAQLRFTLKHFVGGRFALFAYSTKTPGGSAVFKDFTYESK